MPLRGDYLNLRVQQHSSGTVNEVIAETTSVSINLSAEALETTSQTDGLNAGFIAGKVTGTASGEYLLASGGTQFDQLFIHMNAGNTLEFEWYVNSVKKLDGSAVITGLDLSGANSDQLATGSYSLQLSGNLATA